MSMNYNKTFQDTELNKEELLQVKNWMTPSPFCIEVGQSLREAAEKMEQYGIDGLPIIDENHHFVGMITLRNLLHYFMQGKSGDSVSTVPKRNVATIKEDDSIIDVASLPYNELPVLDYQGKLVGILTRRDIIDGYSKYMYKLKQTHHTAEALSIILESAYEGIAVVNEHGILQEFNEAYSRFTGVKRDEAIGRHVTEVIENTNLHITVKTGIPEHGVVQHIQGQDMVVHRIPIWKNNRVVGAIGMLMFEGVTEAYKMYQELQNSHLKERTKATSLTINQERDSRLTMDQIIGISEEISTVKRLARRAARTSATVLITGESGTGKELFAKSIHHLSPFATGPFISVNCGAIPEHLFESELFGYEEGAFTGARKGGKPGKFELADNGTIFLDEIGELPLMMQTKLLRVLQEKETERIGGIKKLQMNVRVIAATNRNLKAMVKAGKFREDLYYRLNIIQLHIPPLRERQKDIPILMSHYMKEICEQYGMERKSFTSNSVLQFIQYEWHGNIRELVNTIEQLVTMVDGDIIEYHHLPTHLVEVKQEQEIVPIESSRLIEEAKQYGSEKEKELIIKSLQIAKGNKSKAADLLGIHRTSLYKKLRKHGMVN